LSNLTAWPHLSEPPRSPFLSATAEVLDICTISRPYTDRPPSTLERVYVNVVPRTDHAQARAEGVIQSCQPL